MSERALASSPFLKKQSTARTTVLTFASVLGGAALAFGTTLYVGNQIGEKGAGLFFQIMAFFSIASVFVTLGADTGLVRTLAAQRAVGTAQHLRRTAAIAGIPVAGFAALIGGVLWLAAAALEEALVIPGLAQVIQVLALLLVPAALMNLGFGAMRGMGRVAGFSGIQNVLLPVLRLGAVAWAIALGGSLLQLATAYALPVLLAAALAGVAAWLAITRFSPAENYPAPGPKAVPEPDTTVRKFWGFSSARGVSALVETLLEWIDVIAVAVFLGPAAAGIYGAVNRCVRLGVMLEHTARLVTGPMLSACLAVGDHAEAKRLFSNTAKLLVWCAWPFYLTLAIFGEGVLSLFGAGFARGALPLAVISLVMMLVVSAGGVQSVLLMGGKSRWQLGNKLSALAVALLFNLWLVPLWGLMGAITAWSLAALTDCALATVQVARSLRLGAPVRELIPLAALSLLIFGAGGLLCRVLFEPSLLVAALHLAVALPIYVLVCVKFGRRLGLEAVLSQLMHGVRKRRAPAADRAAG